MIQRVCRCADCDAGNSHKPPGVSLRTVCADSLCGDASRKFVPMPSSRHWMHFCLPSQLFCRCAPVQMLSYSRMFSLPLPSQSDGAPPHPPPLESGGMATPPIRLSLISYLRLFRYPVCCPILSAPLPWAALIKLFHRGPLCPPLSPFPPIVAAPVFC